MPLEKKTGGHNHTHIKNPSIRKVGEQRIKSVAQVAN